MLKTRYHSYRSRKTRRHSPNLASLHPITHTHLGQVEECGVIYLHVNERRPNNLVLVPCCKKILVFDDCFKKWNADLKKFVDMTNVEAAHYVAETEFFLLQELVRVQTRHPSIFEFYLARLPAFIMNKLVLARPSCQAYFF